MPERPAARRRAQADSFRTGNNSVANEFWRGFEYGFDHD
jgi:hypothetical protein